MEGDTFNDALGFSSGFTNKAYKALISVTRSSDKELKIIDLSTEELVEFSPEDGDIYVVNKILMRFSNRVQIEGAVYREGQYELTDGLTLKALINKADGLRGDAYLTRAEIYRTNEDFSQLILPIDLESSSRMRLMM